MGAVRQAASVEQSLPPAGGTYRIKSTVSIPLAYLTQIAVVAVVTQVALSAEWTSQIRGP